MDGPATTLRDVGEYELHALLQRQVNTDGERVLGDDCAVVPLSDGASLLVNTDRLASNVQPYNRARLCVVQTLSDIICMGGSPSQFLVALTLPRETPLAEFSDLMGGLVDELARYGCRLVGGDTKEGAAFHMVGMGLGTATSPVVRRTGAHPGMTLGVTLCRRRRWGMRWAHAVVAALGLDVPAELVARCRDADRVIELPLDESAAAIATGHIRAGLDLSDGIGGGVYLLGRDSGVGIALSRTALRSLVDVDLAPVADALGLPLECLALSPGYNWENLYAVDTPELDRVVDAVAAAGGEFVPVGTATDDGVLRVDGREVRGGRLPADEKFAKAYAWEERFAAWRDACRDLFGPA